MREALIVWGGWSGHEPEQGAKCDRGQAAAPAANGPRPGGSGPPPKSICESRLVAIRHSSQDRWSVPGTAVSSLRHMRAAFTAMLVIPERSRPNTTRRCRTDVEL